MKKYIIIIVVLLFVTEMISDNKQDKVEFYKNRYKVNCLDEKITDNYGKGFDDLYGTRNMRTILYGIAYRGGGNNYYHKSNKRENKNPLPPDGLENLSDEGFSAAIYLYTTNWKTAPRYFYNQATKDTLNYSQNSLSNNKQIKQMLYQVKDIIDNKDKGPIYLHCWNGWHQSGYASSIILMQFCKFSNDKALKYWKQNADGGTKGYDHIIKLIKNFKPYKEITITDSTREEICPCLK